MKASYNRYIKKITLMAAPALVLFFFLPALLSAQNFEEGMRLYEQGNFEEAAFVFQELPSDKARLFAGKAYFGMGHYLTAKALLEELLEETGAPLSTEVRYTLALTQFQLKQYGDALSQLHRISQQDVQSQLVMDAEQFYEGILDFMTLNQRREALTEATVPVVKYDVVASAFGRVDLPVARMLYEQLVHARVDSTHPEMRKLAATLKDSSEYAVEQAYNPTLEAPDGITYNIGAALPSYDTDAPEFEVVRGLYFGYVLAAEQFNQQQTDQKAFIRYQNTASSADSARYAMTNFAYRYRADAVLGPLFSEPAHAMAPMAEEYHIPLIAPLANSDTLNVDNPYFYQANATFASYGKGMAEYAVKTLGLDTLAVLAEAQSRGETSAYAFRNRAEKLGAKVAYFFSEDLEEKGYELTEYTKYFTTDTAVVDSMKYQQVDGIYAPFTGQAASNLANLLLADLEALDNHATVLGSQAWGTADLPEHLLSGRTIYFSESNRITGDQDRVTGFNEAFKKRFSVEPNRYAMIGYDVASFVLETLKEVGNPALLKNALKQQPPYRGLISTISFDGTHINQHVEVFRLTQEGTVPAAGN